MGWYESAIADAEQVLRLNDKSPMAYAIRARAFNETGRKEEAEADIQMARQLSLSTNITPSP